MKIAIVGLGLIGGSMAKAISGKTDHTVDGYDLSQEVLLQAMEAGAIGGAVPPEGYQEYDIILISLYPQDTIAFLQTHYPTFSKKAIVVDLCGVKKTVCDFAKEIFCEIDGPVFIGGHPMAGKEVSGFAHSTADLFQNASMILTPEPSTDSRVLLLLEGFFLSLGFGRITRTTPEHHDQVIAYTSQMAHVVSNAYMQSPTAEEFMGFSAGSFADLTRVAKLNETMWTELFLNNQQPLVEELDILLENLQQFRDFIAEGDAPQLKEKLRHGRERKEHVLKTQSKEGTR